MKNRLKIIIAGGGTGGHIFPAIAIANAIKKSRPDAEILFVGARGKMEMEKVPQAGYSIVGLTIAGFDRSSLIKNIGLPFKVIKSFFEVAAIFKKVRPDAVIGVGGYSSFPVLRYAQMKRIPTFIHEANSFGGKSNMMLAKKAVMVFTGTDGMERFFPAGKIVVTGNPVRQTILNNNLSREEACNFFGFNPAKKVVLVVGGSLGAVSINKAILNGLEALNNNAVQLIWQTGKLFFEEAQKASEDKNNIACCEFIVRMDMAYAAADVVVSRSGAMTLAELCVVKKPAILVPYPFAAEDHQTANAMNLVSKQAALMVKDSDVSTQLVSELLNLLNNENYCEILKENISKQAITNADELVANDVLQYIEQQHD